MKLKVPTQGFGKKLDDPKVTFNATKLVQQMFIIIYHERFELGQWCSGVQYNFLTRRIEPDWQSELRYFNRCIIIYIVHTS